MNAETKRKSQAEIQEPENITTELTNSQERHTTNWIKQKKESLN